MKKIFILLVMLMGISIMGAAQSPAKVERQGNTFVQVSSNNGGGSATQTQFTYKDKSDTEYPIFITANGRCFINKVSKNGNTYKKYLDEQTARTICAELGVEYKEKSGGNK